MKPGLIIFLITYFLTIQGNNNLNNESINTVYENPVFCVLFHSPGVNWKEGIPFQEQPGVEEHVKYMRQQLENGFLVMGGPFLDNSGGMMICRTSDLQKAEEIAESDPAVIAGLLKVDVKKWMIPMSSIDLFPNKDN